MKHHKQFGYSSSTVASIEIVSYSNGNIHKNGLTSQFVFIDSDVMPMNKTQFVLVKKNYIDRYEKISKANWFLSAYSGKSLGEISFIEL